MAKYNFELKIKIIKEYLDGEGGYNYLAKKYGVKSKTQIENWVRVYKEFGEEGLLRKRKNQKYSVQFKLDAIELYQTSEMSYREVAYALGINNPPLINAWMREFRVNGVEGLSKPRGRPSNMPKKNKDKNIKNRISKEKPEERDRIKELEKQVRSLQIENAFLKRIEEAAKTGSPTKTQESIARIIDSLRGSFKLVELLETLKFPKATYMYWQKRFNRVNPDQEIENEMLEIRNEHKDYGCLRMTRELKNRGFHINKKKVQRLIKKLGIEVKSYTRKSRRYSSYRGKVGTVAKNRIHRRFYTSVCHQKITTDTTEFKYFETDTHGVIRQKKLYLDPFMDLYNSEILSYRISERPNAVAIMEGLEEAIQVTNDCPFRRTFHSDQGWAYQMKTYSSKLKEHKIFQSMSRKGNCLDNSPMENFFSLLKQEIFHGEIYRSFDELKTAIDHYIYYYNNKRMKKKLNWQSPVQFRETAQHIA